MGRALIVAAVACGGGDAVEVRSPDPVEGIDSALDSAALDTSAGTGSTADTGTAPFALAPLTWVDCGDGTTCADVAVPAVASDPSGPTLTVHLRRRRGLPAARTLWLVDGGPGDPATRLVPDLAFFQDVFPDMTIVAVDHRGTGASAPLACPTVAPDGVVADVDWAACGDEVDATTPLHWFSAEAAARDLAWLIPAASDGEAVVWGISYGTHVVQRLLAQSPEGVQGAILDGVVPPDWTFADFDDHMDAVGRDYLALCDADAVCAARLGGDAAGFVQDALAGPACGALDASGLRALLGALLLQGDDRAAIPAVAWRYARCSPDDVAALTHLVAGFEGAESDQNELLLAQIGTHELWPSTGAPTAEEAAADLDTHVVGTGAGAWMAARAEAWPRSEVVPLDASAASQVDLPVLLLHGGLDPTAPLSALASLEGAYPSAQWVVPPGAGHVALNFSSCAVDAYLSFLEAPGATVAPCDNEPFTEVFALSPSTSQALFGQDDPWGDP